MTCTWSSSTWRCLRAASPAPGRQTYGPITPALTRHASMSAVVVKGDRAQLVHNRPLPQLRDNYVLVKPHAVALNPTDWKHIAYGRAKDGALIGCDYAGVVEEVGKAVTKKWQKGDSICGVVHGSNLVQAEDGAFAEYIVAKGDVQMRKPAGLSYVEAATISLGAITVGQGLYQKSLGLNLPTDPSVTKEYVLIYGGGTSVGGLAIQFAKLSGYRVITVCHPDQYERLYGLGAENCFDYQNPESGHEIRRLTENSLRYAWDTIAIESTAQMCAEALTTYAGARYGTTNPMPSPREDVVSSAVVMYTMMGEEFIYGGKVFPASPEDFEFAKMFMGLTEELLTEGKLQTHPAVPSSEGLAGVVKGLEELKAGKVHSAKLVYQLVHDSK